jgi:hypothetical protein
VRVTFTRFQYVTFQPPSRRPVFLPRSVTLRAPLLLNNDTSPCHFSTTQCFLSCSLRSLPVPGELEDPEELVFLTSLLKLLKEFLQRSLPNNFLQPDITLFVAGKTPRIVRFTTARVAIDAQLMIAEAYFDTYKLFSSTETIMSMFGNKLFEFNCCDAIVQTSDLGESI